MSLRTRIAKGFLNIGKNLIGGYDGADSAFTINQLYGNYNDSRKLGKYKGIVFAAVNLISDEVAKYQPVFNTMQADGHLEPITGTHPLLELLAHPSKEVSQADFFKAVSVYQKILGESFWYIPLGTLTRKPNLAKGSEIFLLPPEKMGLKIGDDGSVIGYCLRRPNGSEVLFKPEEIKHHKTFNPNNPYRGYGIVEAAIDYIETEEGARTYTKNFFKNNGAPAGILSVKGDISKENFKIFAERWREQNTGTRHAGKIAIIRASDIGFTKTSLGLDELDMTALKQMTVSEVLRMFRVPKALLGEETDQGFGRASVETLEYIFAKRTIEPELELLDNSIQELLTRFYRQDKLIVSHKNIIPADKEFELKLRQASVDVWKTRNEIRQEDGLDDEPGADQLFVPAMSVPIGIPDDESKDVTDVKGEKKLYLTAIKTVKKKTDVEISSKEAFRLSLQRKQRLFEARFAEALAPVLRKQKKEVLENWSSINASAEPLIVKATNSRLLDLDKAIKDFQKVLFPVELSLADEQGNLALDFAGDDESDFELTPHVQKKIRDALEKMSYNFNEETLTNLTDVIAQDIGQGLSTEAIAKDIAHVYNDVSGYRAERLARTETLRASNQATKLAYEQTGFVTSLQWYANPGACPLCEEMAGEEVGFEENFADLGDTITGADGSSLDINYSNVDTPPLHPNCECTILPVRE